MKRKQYKMFKWLLVLLVVSACREPFIPPDIKSNTNYLVVDGFLNAGDSTTITLSRTRNLGDSVPASPELNAQVSVLGEFGESFLLNGDGNGHYIANTLLLSTTERYRLQILTSDGKKYLSDSVAVATTPPIDSISWKQDTSSASNKLGVTVYANTHDPLNNTRYYRWEYAETWQYHTPYYSDFYYDGTQVVQRTPAEIVYNCWRSAQSTSLLLASSASLNQDVIFEKPIFFIPVGDQRLQVKYSILVKQFALTREAYEYWENLKKNTELTGSIFDPQPSQMNGNLHCVTNPDEVVLGYIGASTAQSQRIFIDNNSTAHWGFIESPQGCVEIAIPLDSVNYYFKSFIYIPTSALPSPPRPPGWFASTKACVDCTLQGGINVKPAFWP